MVINAPAPELDVVVNLTDHLSRAATVQLRHGHTVVVFGTPSLQGAIAL